MEVIRDIKKMINQVFGKENMFGFETTLANQMYLLYCVIGNVYYTDKIHRKTKLVWFWIAYTVWLPIFISILLYIVYGRLIGDVMLLIYMGFAIIFALMETIVKPAIAVYWYRNNIEQMISMADKILTKTPSTKRSSDKYMDPKKITSTILVELGITIVLYGSIPILDVIIFYRVEKVENYMYYMLPLSGLEQFASFKFYMIYHIILYGMTCGLLIIFSVHRVFSVPWVVICHNEAQRIIDELNSLSEDTDINIDTFRSMEPKCRYVLKKCIHDIRNLNRFISTYRGFFETIASLTLPILLYIEVVHALIAVSPDIPVIIRLREVFVFLISIQEVYNVLDWGYVGTNYIGFVLRCIFHTLVLVEKHSQRRLHTSMPNTSVSQSTSLECLSAHISNISAILQRYQFYSECFSSIHTKIVNIYLRKSFCPVNYLHISKQMI
ncbi:uncharacterized protein LOC135834566 [Planococcus citri]|uniref:uncharacterized protein LOC135834566 n=1 Tax=Planococcus citri TaxID=170843 RepID=UPI0031F7B2C1